MLSREELPLAEWKAIPGRRLALMSEPGAVLAIVETYTDSSGQAAHACYAIGVNGHNLTSVLRSVEDACGVRADPYIRVGYYSQWVPASVDSAALENGAARG